MEKISGHPVQGMWLERGYSTHESTGVTSYQPRPPRKRVNSAQHAAFTVAILLPAEKK